MNEISQPKKKLLPWFILLSAPFFLNDFANIYLSKNWIIFFIIDYVFCKAFPFFIFLYLYKKQRLTLNDIGIKSLPVVQLIIWAIIMTIIGIGIDQTGWRFFENILPKTQLGGFPKIPVPWFDKFDLFFGIMCVGIFEETIFRGMAFTVLRQYFKSTISVFIISSIIFGLIHWSWGVHAIINTAIIGAIFMSVMWKTGSVLPVIIAHFLVDYVSFSGVIPYNSPFFNFLK